jgi:pimeloyl-ACP methyl ester carboxylesterase
MTVQDHYPFSEIPVQSITLSSGPVFYQHYGNGFPLIFIHGWGGSSDYWNVTMKNLSDTYACYALDLPGYGRTPPLLDIASAERLAEVVMEFADTLALTQFDLNGHSFGGAVAAYIAAAWPERVRHLVLTSFGWFKTEAEQQAMAQAYYTASLMLGLWKPWLLLWQPWTKVWQKWMATVGCETSLMHDLARPFFVEMPGNDELLCAGYMDFMSMDYRTSLESSVSLANPTLLAALRQVSAPTLLIGARQDRMILPSQAENAAQLIPRCRIGWMNQCGHIPMIERPQEYQQLLRDFLVV